MANPSSEEDEEAGWTIGHMEDIDGHVSYIEGRELSHQQIANYREAVGFVVEYQDQPVQGQIHIDGTGRNLELYFDRDELLSKFKKWKRVKPDLIAGSARLNPDDHIEGAMATIMGLVSTVREIDQQRFERSAEVLREVVGPPPKDPGHRPVIFHVKRLNPDAGAIAMETLPAMVPNVQPDGCAENRDIPIPDFRAERPTLQVDRQDYSCQGPMNRVTHLPSEACTARATTLFFFPHQEGVAFVFGCDEHALALGRWAGQRFGGCFGDSVLKAPRIMEQASNRFARVDLPHGEDFDQLLPVPNPPQIQSPLT